MQGDGNNCGEDNSVTLGNQLRVNFFMKWNGNYLS